MESVILKDLESVESAKRSWFEEANKIFSFNNLPEPRNATKDELEGYHSIQNDLGIPNTNDIMYNNKIEQNDENEPEDSALK
ncbi:unnamed protein product [Rhizophagus irregularis]|nr:unnamed protein product [Rhizophagus irregularis]